MSTTELERAKPGELMQDAADKIKRLQEIVDRQSKALNACKRELILYAGEHPDDWDDGTADAICHRCTDKMEIERLQAIVDRMPKTADEVPIVFGGTYYYIDDENETEGEITVRDIESPYRDVDWLLCGKGVDVYASMCYSTREAAEKARAT